MRLQAKAGPLARGGALLVLAALALWLNRETALQTAVKPLPDGVPVHWIADFEIRAFDERGAPAHYLRGARIEELSGGRGYRIDQPHYTLWPRDGGAPWTLQAQSGWSSADREQARLDGEVDARRPALGDAGALEIRSRDVWLYPAKRQVRSDAATRIEEPERWHSDSQGFAADFNAERLDQEKVRETLSAPGQPVRAKETS